MIFIDIFIIIFLCANVISLHVCNIPSKGIRWTQTARQKLVKNLREIDVFSACYFRTVGYRKNYL